MSSVVNDRYLEARVMSASPVELVRMLYGAAVESVRQARGRLAAGDIEGRSREISRGLAILAELTVSLDRARGGDLARDLADLYDYMSRRLLEANFRQADEPLAEVLEVLNTLAEGWKEPAGALPARAPAGEDGPREECPRYGLYMPAPAFAPAGQSWSA